MQTFHPREKQNAAFPEQFQLTLTRGVSRTLAGAPVVRHVPLVCAPVVHLCFRVAEQVRQFNSSRRTSAII